MNSGLMFSVRVLSPRGIYWGNQKLVLRVDVRYGRQQHGCFILFYFFFIYFVGVFKRRRKYRCLSSVNFSLRLNVDMGTTKLGYLHIGKLPLSMSISLLEIKMESLIKCQENETAT